MSTALLSSAAIAAIVLWAFYGFHFPLRPLGLPMKPPLAEYAARINNPAKAHVILALARWHIFPEAYLYGMADVLQIADGSATYIFGRVYPRGQWFYFPAAFLIKSTLPVLLLLLLLPLVIWRGKRKNWNTERYRKAAFLLVPPAVYLLVAMRSGLNIGVRHILPVFPFLLILAALAGWTLARRHQAWAYAVAVLLAWHVFSSAHSFPNYLAYSNELWGGPANTYKVLSDSNADWGQQLPAVSRYLARHQIRDCWFAYFADAASKPAYYGVPCRPLTTIGSMWLEPLPDMPRSIDGTVLVSAGVLSGYELGPGKLNPYAQFQGLSPVAEISDGVFVYEGRFDMSLAAALNHIGKVWHLAGFGDLNGAVNEARAAVDTAPGSVRAQSILGDMLMAVNQPDEARLAYQRALALTATLEPEYQKFWGDMLRKKLAS